jgi:hypothetical protein
MVAEDGKFLETDSANIVLGVLKSREIQLLTICLQLKLESSDGKKYETDCANAEGVLRNISEINNDIV